ncbi:MAG TPA: hypothetical protein VF881_15705 [Polyangiaceae bacterium]
MPARSRSRRIGLGTLFARSDRRRVNERDEMVWVKTLRGLYFSIVLAMGGAACNAILGNEPGETGYDGSSAGAGYAGSTAATSGASGAGGAGGAVGMGGFSGGGSAGGSGIVLRGGIGRLAGSPPAGSIVLRQSGWAVPAGPTCNGSLCLSGGIVP